MQNPTLECNPDFKNKYLCRWHSLSSYISITTDLSSFCLFSQLFWFLYLRQTFSRSFNRTCFNTSFWHRTNMTFHIQTPFDPLDAGRRMHWSMSGWKKKNFIKSEEKKLFLEKSADKNMTHQVKCVWIVKQLCSLSSSSLLPSPLWLHVACWVQCLNHCSGVQASMGTFCTSTSCV